MGNEVSTSVVKWSEV